MRFNRAPLLTIAAVVALVWPAAGAADHVGVEATATAALKERASSRSWIVEVTWTIRCLGVRAGPPVYFGNGSLIDDRTREELYLGGVSTASGKVRQVVGSKAAWRRVHPEFRVSCGENLGGHGSDFIDVVGNSVSIPPLGADGGTAGAGGGGGGSGGGDPAEPPRAGGCRTPIVGTDGPDTLSGTGAGDVIFGRGGKDVLRGRGGHDCLIGASGNDTLRGEAGDDRLTGGAGADTLVGGPGVNVYDAGAGNDVVDAANRRAELVRCGAGRDRARVDRRDTVSGCEVVSRAAG